jgi:hypothetical protein
MARFVRGSGPLVSILLPTRGRPELLLKSVESLFNTAHSKASFELMIKVDDDDLVSKDMAEKISKYLPVTCLITPRGNGYLDMHHWLNQLVKLSRGDWVITWSDDAEMKTLGWDWILDNSISEASTAACANIFAWICKTTQREGSSEFIFVRKKVCDILGHLTLSPHIDTWVFTVMAMIQAIEHAPIEVSHDRVDDEGRFEASKVTLLTLLTPQSIRQKIADAMLLQDYIEIQMTAQMIVNNLDDKDKEKVKKEIREKQAQGS